MQTINVVGGAIKMVFKQGVLKEEKIKFTLSLCAVAFPYIIIIVYSLLYHSEFESFATFLLVFFFSIFLLLIFMGIKNLEWYCIFDDRIEARCIYGVKNSVHYDEVVFIEEAKINLTTRGMQKTFYVFNDGRKNIFGINSCYNNKKFNFRIYKTNELENYIQNTLNLAVRN